MMVQLAAVVPEQKSGWDRHAPRVYEFDEELNVREYFLKSRASYIASQWGYFMLKEKKLIQNL